MNRLFILVLISLLVSSAPVFADTFVKIDNIHYKLTQTPYTGEDGVLQAAVSSPDGKTSYDGTAYTGVVDVPAFITSGGQRYAVTSVSNHCFAYQTGVTEVKLPSTITTIEHYAFRDTSIEELTIPEAVTSIGMGVVSYCTKLRQINVFAPVPPVLNSSFATIVDKKSMKVFVPAGSLEAYMNATGWKEFPNIQILPEQQILPQSIEISPASFKGYPESGFSLSWTISPENTDDKSVSIISSAPEVATVDENGKVTLKTPGECTITITCAANPEVKAVCNVVCEEDKRVFPQQIEVDLEAIMLPVGSEFNVGAKVLPEDCFDKSIKYTSSDPDVASIDPEGNVKLNRFGICFLYATSTVDPKVGTAISVQVRRDTLTIEGILFRFHQPSFSAAVLGAKIPQNGLFEIPEKIKAPFTGENVYPVTSIADSAFQSCASLKNIYIPSSIKAIGKEAFANSALIVADLPRGLAEIAEGTFAGCQDLVSVSLPSSIRSIGKDAFAGAEKIRFVRSQSTNPPVFASTGEEPFQADVFAKADLMIPSSAESTYAGADGWKNFQHTVGWNQQDVMAYKMELPQSVEGRVGDSIGINPVFTPADPSYTDLFLFIADPEIASADGATLKLLKEGETEVMAVNGLLYSEFKVIVKEFSGVDSIEDTTQSKPRWFNLQGVEIASPEPGMPVIEIRNGKSCKRIFTR